MQDLNDLVYFAEVVDRGGFAAAGRALGLPKANPGLLALREILSFVVYVVACSGRTVIWRGRQFVVRADGTLDQVEGSQT